MTPDEVRARVDTIRAETNDPETAHADEDQLFTDVLMAIFAGATDDPAALAREALESILIEFPRWCA